MFALPVFQSLLLSVWLQREKEMLQEPEETVKNLHTLLIALSNMKGVCLCICPVCADFFAQAPVRQSMKVDKKKQDKRRVTTLSHL